MVFAHQIREVVEKYVSKSLDAEKFVREFAALSYNIRSGGEAEAVRLANAIEFHLVDARSGCISEAQLRSTLDDLVSVGDVNNMVMAPQFPVCVNQFLTPEIAFPAGSGSFGTLRGVELGLVEYLQP
jgi:hypothetical protein